MKNTLTAGAALLLTTSIASAGGVERAAPSAALLFEEGNYLELNFGYVSPEVSGTQAFTAGASSLAGASTGDMAEDYVQLGFGYKNDLNDKMSLAIIFDQPYGADVNYADDTAYAYGGGLPDFGPIGSTATIDSNAVTVLVSYEVRDNVTVYGGGRAVQTAGEVALFNTYTMETSTETDFGYVVGAAWERPDIAARVSLTYHSEITHDFDSTEAYPAESIPETERSFSTTLPQSITLEGQTGIAADTLLFGSVRWVDWTAFDITPPIFALGGSSLVDYSDDSVTYNLGVGRRFNDEWSGAVTAGYEAAQGGFSGNLGPTDGNKSLGVAVTRTMDALRITGGVRYIWIGDAETEAPGAFPVPPGTTLGEFEDNSGWAAGVRIAYNF
ncbi:outer membrane protein transport protein [Yoonia sp.]|uniref:outer membrane protein transport protein n=1 Tax=Yoonia sp. TaxID=2212373 RepID=UPI00358E3ADF